MLGEDRERKEGDAVTNLLDDPAAVEALRQEIAALRETVKRLNRRTQQAEAALGEFRKIMERHPDEQGIRFVSGSLGRALCAWAYAEVVKEREALLSKPVQGFAEMAKAANGRWDGVDAEEYVRQQRADDPLPSPPSFVQALDQPPPGSQRQADLAVDFAAFPERLQ